MKRGYMKKFLLILSCFLAETCVIEKSIADEVVIPLRDVMDVENTKQTRELDKLLKCKDDPVALWKTVKNYALNECTPYSSCIITIWNRLEALGQINDMTDTNTALHLIQRESCLCGQTFSAALDEAILSAAYGALWNVEINPLKEGHILRPQTEKKYGNDVFADNPYKKKHKKLCEIAILYDHQNLQYREMSKDEQYVYNQKLGLRTWHAGLNPVERQLQAELSQAKKDLKKKQNNLKNHIKLFNIAEKNLEISKNDLGKAQSTPQKEQLQELIKQDKHNIEQKKLQIGYIRKQILNAYYWAMLRNPKKEAPLMSQYRVRYYHSLYYSSIDDPNNLKTPLITKLNDMPSDLKPLFFSDDATSEVSIDFTELKNKSDTINYFRRKGIENLSAIDLDSGLDTYNGRFRYEGPILPKALYFAIGELAPVIARGLVIKPILELNIMKSKLMDSKLKLDDLATIDLSKSTGISFYHFGYIPLKINSGSKVDTFAAFLPTYLLKEQDGLNKPFYRNFCERQIQKELQPRCSQEISRELLNAYQNMDEQFKNWLYNEGLEQKRRDNENDEQYRERQNKRKEFMNSYNQRRQLKEVFYRYQDFNEDIDNGTQAYNRIQRDMYSSIDTDDLSTDTDDLSTDTDDLSTDTNRVAPKVAPLTFSDFVTTKDNSDSDDDPGEDRNFDDLLVFETETMENIENNQKFKATDENSIDPRLPMFGQRTDSFAYREFY